MLKRSSTAVWKGNGLEGKGLLTTQSGALRDLPYSTHARFGAEDGRAGTNPEELIAAAHAGCYAMALSFGLTGAGFVPNELNVDATVIIDKQDVHWFVKKIELKLRAKVPGIDEAKFRDAAEAAKKGCPISRALSAVEITLDARLM